MIDEKVEDIVVKLCIKSYIKGLVYATDTLIKTMDKLGVGSLNKMQLYEAQRIFETQDMDAMMEIYRNMVKESMK